MRDQQRAEAEIRRTRTRTPASYWLDDDVSSSSTEQANQRAKPAPMYRTSRL